MKLQLVRTKEEVPGVTSFIFKPEGPFVWKAGQFLHYVLHHEPTDSRGSDRWFTISSAPYEGEVVITTRITSEKGSSFKTALQALKVGEYIEASEVEGDFTVDDPASEYVFIAGGIGVTPFHSILKEAEHAGTKLNATLLYANRDTNVPFKEELEVMQKSNPNLKVHYITAPERIDEPMIKKLVPNISKPIFYVSGPEPMVEALGKTLLAMGVPAEHLKQDFFPGYPME